MKKIYIVNPIAGGGKAMRVMEELSKVERANGVEFAIEYTKQAGDAEKISRRYATGGYRLFSVGGDGTANEVINGVVGGDSYVSVIAAGSGNDFLRSISAFSGGTEVDVGMVNGRYFANIASIGFDAEVTHHARRFKKIPLLRGIAYFLAIFYTLMAKKTLKVTVDIDGRIQDRELLLMAAANGKYYGGGMPIAPNAKLDDGLLEVCMVEKMPRRRILLLLPRLLSGTHIGLKQVEFTAAKNVKLQMGELAPLCIDGEVLYTRYVEMGIVNKGLKIFV